MARKAPSPVYSVHPSVATLREWAATLPEKTGRSLDDWIGLVRESAPGTVRDRRDWLRAEHGLGTNTAQWIAERAEEDGPEGEGPAPYLKAAGEWVDEMFAGKKAGLRPLYDALIEAGLALGPGVKASPCKTIVPLHRRHVFAQIKPTTNTRIDLGLALGDLPATGRLIETGGFAKKDRMTHRIPLETAEEVDDEVREWLREAYERDGAGG